MATLITDKDYYNLMKDIDTATLENTLVKELTDRNMKISSAERKWTLATAESCTGGMISQRITNVSGASNVFELGVCSYANRIKNKVLGVSNETLNTVGAVSQETATQMCEGIKELSSSDIGVSTTGIAGPTGGTAKKPVGLVFIGIATKESTTIYRAELCHYTPHSRNEVRTMTTNLCMLLAIKATRNSEE